MSVPVRIRAKPIVLFIPLLAFRRIVQPVRRVEVHLPRDRNHPGEHARRGPAAVVIAEGRLAGATLDKGVYRCAVSVAGVDFSNPAQARLAYTRLKNAATSAALPGLASKRTNNACLIISTPCEVHRDIAMEELYRSRYKVDTGTIDIFGGDYAMHITILALEGVFDTGVSALLDGALSPEVRREEARRLVVLIDALYEAKTHLIVLAEAEPIDLYPAGDGSFEFERTASRLQEMRSADWLIDRA